MSHHNNNNNQKPKAFPESFPGDLFPPDISGETSAFTVPKNDPFSKCVTVYGDGCQPARQSSWGCAVPKEFSASSRFRPDQPVQVPRPFPGHVPQTGPVAQLPNPVPGMFHKQDLLRKYLTQFRVQDQFRYPSPFLNLKKRSLLRILILLRLIVLFYHLQTTIALLQIRLTMCWKTCLLNVLTKISSSNTKSFSVVFIN